MAAAGTVAVLLPGAFYTLRERQPPVELFRRHGVPIALATDCNPGSSPVVSILAILNMACTLFGLTEEALAGSPGMPPARSGWTIAARSRWASAPISPFGGSIARPSSATGSASRRSTSYSGTAGVRIRVPAVDPRLYQRQFATKISHKRSKGGGRARGSVGWAEETTLKPVAPKLSDFNPRLPCGAATSRPSANALSLDHALPSGAAEHLIVPLQDGSGDRLVASCICPKRTAPGRWWC